MDELVNDIRKIMKKAGSDFDNLLAQAKQQEGTLVIMFDGDAIKPPYENWKLESDNGKKPTGEIRFKLVSVLEDDKTSITGDEMMKRAKKMGADWCEKVGEKILANQDKIPEEWRQYYIILPGTVWLDSDGDRDVAYLRWDGERWVWDFNWLGLGWHGYARFLLSCK